MKTVRGILTFHDAPRSPSFRAVGVEPRGAAMVSVCTTVPLRKSRTRTLGAAVLVWFARTNTRTSPSRSPTSGTVPPGV